LNVLNKALAPTGSAFRADAAQAGGRVFRKGDRLAKLIGRFDPRDDDAFGANIEGPLYQGDVALRYAYEHDGVAPDRRAHVLDDFFPIEVPVLGIDDHPIKPQSNGHFSDAWAFQRHPQPEHGLVARQFLLQFLDRRSFHRLHFDQVVNP
jgi:hypothetical protein